MKGRETFYLSIGEIQRDLDAFMSFYNLERSHQGYRLNGRTPAQALREALGVNALPSFELETIDESSIETIEAQPQELKILKTPRLRRRSGDRLSGNCWICTRANVPDSPPHSVLAGQARRTGGRRGPNPHAIVNSHQDRRDHVRIIEDAMDVILALAKEFPYVPLMRRSPVPFLALPAHRSSAWGSSPGRALYRSA